MSLFTKWGWMVMAIGTFAPVSLLYAQTDSTTTGDSSIFTPGSLAISDEGSGVIIVDPAVYEAASAGTVLGVSLTKVGTGTLTLTGGNSYSGGTNVDSGTLQINGGVPVSSTTDGGPLVPTTATDGGTLSVSGATVGGAGVSSEPVLVQMGTGTLTLSGDNTYAGGTTIDSGVLQINGGTIVPVTDSETLATNSGTSDSGGTVVVSDGSASGFKIISGGTDLLSLGDSPLGMTTINVSEESGGTFVVGLYGTTGGGVDTTLVPSGYEVNYGSFNWGNVFDVDFTSPATVLVSAVTTAMTGDFTQGPQDNLILQLAGPTAGNYAQLNISGNATLQGTLQVKLTNNFISQMSVTDTFTLLNTGGTVTGTFSNLVDGGRITTVDGLGSFQVNYTTNGVVLSNFVAANSTVSLGDNNDVLVSFQSVNGRTYFIQKSTDLKNWNTVQSGITGDGTTMTITFPNGWQGGQAFYRVSTAIQ